MTKRSLDYTTELVVDQSPRQVFDAVKNVRGWWSGLYDETIEGGTEKLNDEFTFRAGGVHYSKQKLIEVIPNEKIVWLVTDSELSFLIDKSEWTGSKVVFEITKQDSKTRLRFTHQGLSPNIACYDACSNAWSQYVHQKLLNLITKGAAGSGATNRKAKSKSIAK